MTSNQTKQIEKKKEKGKTVLQVAAGEHWPACETNQNMLGFFLAGAECNSARVDMDQQRLPTGSLRVEL